MHCVCVLVEITLEYRYFWFLLICIIYCQDKNNVFRLKMRKVLTKVWFKYLSEVFGKHSDSLNLITYLSSSSLVTNLVIHMLTKVSVCETLMKCQGCHSFWKLEIMEFFFLKFCGKIMEFLMNTGKLLDKSSIKN